MPFVLDTSVGACWAFEDEDHPIAAAALERVQKNGAVVPSLWWFEIRNTLLVNERRGRIGQAEVTEFLQQLSHITIAIDTTPDEHQLFTLARRHRLTAYDAAYLELAQRLNAPLATLDDALAAAAAKAKVKLVK